MEVVGPIDRALTRPPPAAPPPNKRPKKHHTHTQNEIYTYLDTDDNRILEVRINLYMYIYISLTICVRSPAYTHIYLCLSLYPSLPNNHPPPPIPRFPPPNPKKTQHPTQKPNR